MAFKLTPEAQERAEKYKQWLKSNTETFEGLDNASLVASARLYMSNMTPLRWAPGEPVYDATMWHIILPELMRRVEVECEPDHVEPFKRGYEDGLFRGDKEVPCPFDEGTPEAEKWKAGYSQSVR